MTQDIDAVNSRSAFTESLAADLGWKTKHDKLTIPSYTNIKLYTEVWGVAKTGDQVSKSDSEMELLILGFWHWVSDIGSLTLSLWHWVPDIGSLILGLWYCVSDIGTLTLRLWHWVSDIGSLTLSYWHWLSGIESLTSTDIDLTNRSLPTFARCVLITLQMAWDLSRAGSWIMMMSIQRKDWSHAYKHASPEWPPRHPRNGDQAPPGSQRLSLAPPQRPKLH